MLNLRTNKLRDFLKQSLKIVLMEFLILNKNSTLNRVIKNYTPEQQKLHDQFEAEATEDAKNKAILC